MPYGTSLRMGRLGYQSDAQSSLAVSYNSLDGYASSLHEALTQPYPAYQAPAFVNPGGGVHTAGHHLADRERVLRHHPAQARDSPGERPLHALRERGVEYVEGAAEDLDLRADRHQGADDPFLDVFLLHAAVRSADDTPQESAALGRNQHRTAAFGRDPAAMLERDGRR